MHIYDVCNVIPTADNLKAHQCHIVERIHLFTTSISVTYLKLFTHHGNLMYINTLLKEYGIALPLVHTKFPDVSVFHDTCMTYTAPISPTACTKFIPR